MNNKFAQQVLEETKNNYNLIAEEFAVSRDYLWEEFKFFAPYLKSGDRVLDLGCGSGRLYSFLTDFKVDYTGLDSSEKLLEEAKKRYAKAVFVHGDILSLPFPDNSFQVILAVAVFHHLPSKHLRFRALQEIKRVLKPGGYFIMTVWNLRQTKYKSFIRRAFWRSIFTFGLYSLSDIFVPWGKDKKIWRYYYSFKPKELRRLVEDNGLALIEEFGCKKGQKVDFEDSFNWCLILKNNE